MADVMLRITGERIATPVCALVRNDILFASVCTYLGAESIENHCHCEEPPKGGDVAISSAAEEKRYAPSNIVYLRFPM